MVHQNCQLHNEMVNVLGDAALPKTMVCKGALKFKLGCMSIENLKVVHTVGPKKVQLQM